MSNRTDDTIAIDPIALEVLRNRLDAIVEEASAAIVRTAISPIVTSGDYAVNIFDGDGALAAAGRGAYIAGASGNSVRATIARYGDTIRPGDVFLANDPHNGGGLHAQDVSVLRPTFVGDRRIAWVVSSAHMMDVGGMVPGSFASGATDCFAEALRLPPVRLFRAG
jgi:N-methylhydantoinase B